MLIKRNTSLYNWLEYSFDVEYNFWRTWPARAYNLPSLERSDFCRIMRVSLIYAPLIWIIEVGSILALSYVMIISTFMNSYNPLNIILTIFGGLLAGAAVGTAGLGALFGLVYGGFWLFKGARHAVAKNEFVSTVYHSVKSRFCPLVKYEG